MREFLATFATNEQLLTVGFQMIIQTGFPGEIPVTLAANVQLFPRCGFSYEYQNYISC